MDTKEIREDLNKRIAFRVLDPTDNMSDAWLESNLQKALDEIDAKDKKIDRLNEENILLRHIDELNNFAKQAK